jgi:hypothetical protein
MKEECNILALFSPEEYRISMRSIIESILSTDITFHHKYFAHIKNKLQTLRQNLYKMLFSDNVQKIFNNQQSLLNWSIHAADISGSSKPFKI